MICLFLAVSSTLCMVPSMYGERNTIDAAGIGATVLQAADLYSLDPSLIHALIRVESDYNPYAVSRKGARGLMQIMPDTARELGIHDIFDVKENIYGGCKYLRRLLNTYRGDLPLALAAYNAGPSAVKAHGGIPPFHETRTYVNRILRLYRGYGIRPHLKVYRDRSHHLVISNVPRRRR